MRGTTLRDLNGNDSALRRASAIVAAVEARQQREESARRRERRQQYKRARFDLLRHPTDLQRAAVAALLSVGR